MQFAELDIPGAYVVSMERHEDSRGFFGRLWDSEEFGQRGLTSGLVQASLSLSLILDGVSDKLHR